MFLYIVFASTLHIKDVKMHYVMDLCVAESTFTWLLPSSFYSMNTTSRRIKKTSTSVSSPSTLPEIRVSVFLIPSDYMGIGIPVILATSGHIITFYASYLRRPLAMDFW